MRLAEQDTGKAKLTAFVKHYMYEQTEAARASTLSKRQHSPSVAQGQTLVNYLKSTQGIASFMLPFHLALTQELKINRQAMFKS